MDGKLLVSEDSANNENCYILFYAGRRFGINIKSKIEWPY